MHILEKEGKGEAYFQEALNQQKEYPLVFDNERDITQKALSVGVPFVYEWMKKTLSEEQQKALQADFLKINQISEYKQFNKKIRLQFPKSALEVIYQAAKAALAEEQNTESAYLFYILTLLFPKSLDVWLGLGIAYQKNEQNRDAIQAFEQAKRLHPQRFQPYLYQAESYLYLNDLSLCEKCCLEAQELMSKEDKRFLSYSEDILNQCEAGRK